MSGCFRCFHDAILTQNSLWKKSLTALLVSIFTHPYSWSLTKHNQNRLLLEHFEWCVLVKISKCVKCVEFIVKIGRTLVAELAYVIAHHFIELWGIQGTCTLEGLYLADSIFRGQWCCIYCQHHDVFRFRFIRFRKMKQSLIGVS